MPNLPILASLHDEPAFARIVDKALFLRVSGRHTGCLQPTDTLKGKDLADHNHQSPTPAPSGNTMHSVLTAIVILPSPHDQTQWVVQEPAVELSGRGGPREAIRLTHKSSRNRRTRSHAFRTFSYRRCDWKTFEFDLPKLILTTVAAAEVSFRLLAQCAPRRKDQDNNKGSPSLSGQPFGRHELLPRTGHTSCALAVANAPAQASARTAIRSTSRVRHLQWNSRNARRPLSPRQTPASPNSALKVFKEANGSAGVRPCRSPYSSIAPALTSGANSKWPSP